MTEDNPRTHTKGHETKTANQSREAALSCFVLFREISWSKSFIRSARRDGLRGWRAFARLQNSKGYNRATATTRKPKAMTAA